MALEFTKAPWEALEVEGTWHVQTAWTNIEDRGDGLTQHGEGIAIVFGGPVCSQGNAVLISKAPEMLTALAEAIAYIGATRITGEMPSVEESDRVYGLCSRVADEARGL